MELLSLGCCKATRHIFLCVVDQCLSRRKDAPENLQPGGPTSGSDSNTEQTNFVSGEETGVRLPPYAQLAGYEDIKDVERVSPEPSVRRIVCGRSALD